MVSDDRTVAASLQIVDLIVTSPNTAAALDVA
jgi:hypothetical protein